jgi:hypothetical protein
VEKTWDLEELGTYSWRYFWTVDLKKGYNIFWLPVPLPLKLMSMLYMKSFGGMVAIVGDKDYCNQVYGFTGYCNSTCHSQEDCNDYGSFADVIWPSTPITPSDNPEDISQKWRFAVNLLTNTVTTKTMNFTHIWYRHGFYNFSITDLNSYQYMYNEMTILPGIEINYQPLTYDIISTDI